MPRKKQFDPLTLFSLLGRLKKIPRTGWLHHGITNVESIAEHSFRVTTMAYLLGPSLECDMHKLTQMALIHDLSEILTGDVVWEHGFTADHDLEKKKRSQEQKAMEELAQYIDHGNQMCLLYKEYEQQETKEAQILKQLDKLEMAQQALEYENPRNPNHLKEFWENAKK
ncbi:MAG: HD domain-containing protein, partial [Nanoarchaeota archaeon]